LFLLSELSAAAVLLNPYTIGIYLEALRFPGRDNLQDLTEWQPMTLRDVQGQTFVVASLLLAIFYRCSPRRVRSWEVLSLVGLGLASLWSTRMVVWWAPVAALLAATHGFAVWRAWRHSPLVHEPPVREGKWSFVALGLAWIYFMVSPL